MARQIRRLIATFSNPASAGAYTAGDEISSSVTAASVVLPTFNVSGFRKVAVHKAGIDVTPASGSLVITAFDFDLFIMKTADAFTIVGDNVAATPSGAQRNKAVKFVFVNGAWTQPTGALTAGASGYQEVLPAVPIVNGGMLEFQGSEGNGEVRTLTAYLQARAAWTPTTVINAFNIWLDLEVEP